MLTLSQLKKKNMRRLMPEGPSWRLHRYKQIPPGGRYELGRTSSLLTSGTFFSDLRTLQHRNTVFIIIVHVIILIIIWTIIFSSCIAVLWFATTSIKKVRLGGVHLSLKMEHFQNKVQSSFVSWLNSEWGDFKPIPGSFGHVQNSSPRFIRPCEQSGNQQLVRLLAFRCKQLWLHSDNRLGGCVYKHACDSC